VQLEWSWSAGVQALPIGQGNLLPITNARLDQGGRTPESDLGEGIERTNTIYKNSLKKISNK
jgi:hypothetical protein